MLADIDETINAEHNKIVGPTENSKLMLQATISIFAEVEDEIEIMLIYGM